MLVIIIKPCSGQNLTLYYLVKLISAFVVRTMDSPLITRWGETLDPEHVLTEYPR
jgi:hypothetical protein